MKKYHDLIRSQYLQEADQEELRKFEVTCQIIFSQEICTRGKASIGGGSDEALPMDSTHSFWLGQALAIPKYWKSISALFQPHNMELFSF